MTDARRVSLRRYPSPLRYPGGKGKVAAFMKLVVLENNLVGADYVEPYAGGASVALSLLYEDYVDHVHINDLNPGVFTFWDAVLRQTDDLCKRIESVPLTMAEWDRQHAVLGQADPDPFELAFATFFLNRTNRSGIVAGGVIGGRDQTGQWTMEARFNRAELVRRVRKVARFRGRISLTNDDAAVVLAAWQDAPQRAFIYLDPPYFVKGEGLYDNFYGPDDHAAIAALVGQLNQPWVVSYDAADAILDLYRPFEQLHYSLRYSAAQRYAGDEAMFFSPGLVMPDVESPAGILLEHVDRRRDELAS